MQLSDFIQKNLATQQPGLIVCVSDLSRHVSAYVQQIWPQGKILVVSEPDKRDLVDQTILPDLNHAGIEAIYCLCVKSAGISFHTQIEDSLEKSSLDSLTGIMAVGSDELFAAARAFAAQRNIRCCAMPDDLCPVDAFDACGKNPCADALFFDLDIIADKYRGQFGDAINRIEFQIAALRLDALTHDLVHPPVRPAVLQALDHAVVPRVPANSRLTEDECAELCEAFVWYALAIRLIEHKSSLQAVLRYAQDSPEFQDYPVSSHIQVLSRILDDAIEIESLEIDPDQCAAHQPPREILNRTLQQILLEDGMKLDLIKSLDYQDRQQLRLSLFNAAENWDEFCARIRPVAEMMQLFAAQTEISSEMDAALKTLWLHAARFAPIGTFLRLMNDMRRIEPALYL